MTSQLSVLKMYVIGNLKEDSIEEKTSDLAMLCMTDQHFRHVNQFKKHTVKE